MANQIAFPIKVYKSDISYFSGKLEAYLRYQQIPYEAFDMSRENFQHIHRCTGVMKIPAIEMSDGGWLFDTTPALAWLDGASDTSIYPHDPALRFVALLIEDYGDEWLWRPAMWWRWVPRASRWTLGWRIADEWAPRMLRRPLGWFFGRRQLREWLWDDGVNTSNEVAVRDMLLREFELLEPLLELQPFLLGSKPSIADYGYFGSMFRHFGNDPEVAELMRRKAPNTYEWTARLWNARVNKVDIESEFVWPDQDFWKPLWQRITRDYLPYLKANAEAFQQNQKSFNFQGDSFSLKGTKTTDYRVWCREVLQKEYRALADADRQRVDSLFASAGGLECLMASPGPQSGMDNQFKLPKYSNDNQSPLPAMKRLLGQPRN